MTIAALYDVHGNLEALDAVLAEVAAAQPDGIVCGGDAVLGPFPVEVLDRLTALEPPVAFLMGNTDRYVLAGRDPGRPDGPWAAALPWVAERLGAARLDRLRAWPATLERDVDVLGPVLFCHGSPRSDEEILTRDTPEARLREAIAGVAQATIVGGHTHMQYDRHALGKRLVNAGSIGMPYEREPGAYWVLLGSDVDHHRTVYDVERAAAKTIESGFPGGERLAQTLRAPMRPEEARALFEGMAAGTKA